MKITNRLNLPEAFVFACTNHTHKQADYSVTQLIKDPHEIVYEKVLSDVLVDDCSDRFWAIFGNAVHKILEEYSPKHEEIQSEVYMETEMAGKKISGTADVIDYANKTIIDYKTCSAWKFRLNDEDLDDWRNQLKAYCYLARMTYGEVYKKGQIVAVLRDWSQTEAERNSDYPQSPVQVLQFDFTGSEILDVREIWKAKLQEIEKLEKEYHETGKIVGYCSDDNCWTTPPVWAVMKEDRKTAVRLFDTEEEAKKLTETDKSLFIQYRAGQHKKCERYCQVAKSGYCRGKIKK